VDATSEGNFDTRNAARDLAEERAFEAAGAFVARKCLRQW
jgi:hypothetical protein